MLLYMKYVITNKFKNLKEKYLLFDFGFIFIYLQLKNFNEN